MMSKKTTHAEAVATGATPETRKNPGHSRGGRRQALAALAACAAAILVAAGCGGGAGANAVHIRDAQHFQEEVLQANKPVLVDFYKGGCPTCIALEPTFKKLSREYSDRVVFARFELMKPYFAVTSAPVKEQYDIRFFPTVILFDQGQEQQRWAVHYRADDYRQALNDALDETREATGGGGTVEVAARASRAGRASAPTPTVCATGGGTTCAQCTD